MKELIQPHLSSVLIALVALAFRHHAGHEARYQRSKYRQELAPRIAGRLPPGPILAVQMHIPYWTGRPYRAIPIGELDLVIEYARSQGAVGLFFDGPADLIRRPHLDILLDEHVPPELQLVHSESRPGGQEVRLFALSVVP